MNFSIISNLRWVYLILAPLFVFLFNEYNAILPNSDGQHYLDLSLMQYKSLLRMVLWWDWLLVWVWWPKPLIFPSLITPFMLLANGDLYLTVNGNDSNSCDGYFIVTN